jgi:hypothetical protein
VERMTFDELMARASDVRQRMRELQSACGLTFPLHVRLEVAIDTIRAGLAHGCALEAAVGYLMLREVVDEAHAEPPAP